MKSYTMPDKCHDEGCAQPVGSRWNCGECLSWEKFKDEKGPFQQLRGFCVVSEAKP
jgi:hypothetical protein